LQLVAAGNGKITMDSIRIVVGEMLAFESNLLSKRKVENEKALANTSLILFTIIILFIVLLFLYLKKIWKYLRVKRSASEALKESHERFNFVSKATSDVVWDWELKTGNLLWGDNFEILFGHQLENPLVHISYWDNFIHPDDKQRIADGLQKEIDGGGNNWKDEYRFLKADGTYAYVTDRAVVIRDEAGEAYRMIGSLRDVTDRKVAEIKIQESEARYRQIVETAQEGIWTVDKDNKTLFVNKKMCTMLEYSYDEMIGRKNTDFMDEEGKIIMIENRAKRIAGIDEHIEMCLTTKNGRIIWVSVAITSNSDNKNNSFGSMAMVTDITNRKRSEEQLKRSNERFRLLVDNVKDYAVYVINTDGIILTWNSGAEKMKGYTSEEITGKSFSIFYTQEQRDNEEHLRSLETVIQQGTYKTEGVRVRKDGSQFWAEVVLSAIYDDAKNLQGIAKITRNITEKKLAEQKFQEISERLSMATSVSNIGMWEWNFAQNTLEWDETSYRLFGLSGNGLNNPIEIINTYVHPEDRERLQETNARALKLQQRLEVDYRVIWPDNSIHHIESRAIVLKDTEGKSLKFLGTNSDITARKKNEESERELHYYIQLLLDSTGEGLFGIDKEGDCTFINKAAAAMLGYNPSDCIGKNMHEQIHYKERNGKACLKAASLINIATLEKRSCYSDSEVFWKADGSSFDVEYSCNPILVKNELKGSVITFNDITQRKKAEAQLIESEKNLNAILLSSNEGLYMLDNNFRLVLMNKANEAIMKQVTKMPCEPGDDFLACFEGDKRNGLRDVFDKVLQGEQIEAEIQMAKNGQELYYSATYFPVRAQNNVITNICCSYKNITDKRRNEEAIKAAYEEKEEFQYRFQAILDNSPQAVLVNDLNGKVTFVNKTFIEAFGYEGREILGKETGDVFNDPGVIEKFYATDDKVLAERKITEWEQKMTVSNGEERDVQITKFPLYDQREKVFGVGTICKDITEIKNYQYELIEAREKAESAERLQEQFLANMSHELRTPMNGIIGMTNVLSNTELQPQQMKHLQIIQHSSLILLDLINDILDLSKIKAGMLTIEKEDFDFNGTIASTTLSFKEKTVEKGIRFTVQTEPFIPRFLSGDPLRLVQILNNLLSNAIKFTEKGIVKIEASLLSKTEGEVIIEFVISDSVSGSRLQK
jgi:PAS domain S-box-containing protein